jgi:phospholipid/cholesterol/gamma-HCH transport system substrate-binding protein
VARSKGLQVVKGRALGVAFLALCLLFVWATYAVFTKKFTHYDDVTLKTSNIGLQLPSRADVKIRGVIVGEVLATKVTANGVDVKLGIYPSQIKTIPKDVTAEILPKTLFGEKYVSLVPPQEGGSTTALRAGDTIGQTQVAIEVEKVLADIYPLLRTVQPEQLNYTLTALSNALAGRGEKLGESLTTLDNYLARSNPQLPQLISDIKQLGSVSQTYADAVPQLADFLRNSVTTGNTLQTNEAKLKGLLDDVAGFSNTSRQFLKANGDNIVRLGQIGQQTLPILAEYSPEYPCLFNAMYHAIPREAGAFRNKELHIILEVLPKQPRGYLPTEKPKNGDTRGAFPYCNLLNDAVAGKYGQNHLPPNTIVPNFDDGVGTIEKRVAPGFDLTGGYVGTDAEKQVVRMLLAGQYGGSPSAVPDLAASLFGPLARGGEVRR